MEINFGASAPYTVGIEEELQLVDPQSLALVPAIDAVFAARDAAGLSADSVASELSASCVELRSPAYGTVAELAADFPVQRRRLRDLVEGCGARVAAAGAHPFSEATAQEITGKARYRKVAEEMGWPALMQAIYGLHVHVSVPDEEHAIRAVAALSRNVPLFVALSANSPFWAGSDTRLASVRTKVFGLMPRTGLPPAFRAWEEFEGYVEALVAAGIIPDYSLCWWDARPHPRLGTVELRAPDAQTESWRVASLAALAQCLVATANEHPPGEPPVHGGEQGARRPLRARRAPPRLLQRPQDPGARGRTGPHHRTTPRLPGPPLRSRARGARRDDAGRDRRRDAARRLQTAPLDEGRRRAPRGRDGMKGSGRQATDRRLTGGSRTAPTPCLVPTP
jgi:carboxylate-amine ligase